MNINNLTEKQNQSVTNADLPESAFVIGEKYFIRTATYHSIGRLIAIYPNELMLEDAAWIADSGRFHDALKTGTLSEVEPFVSDLIVSRGGIIDATVWAHDLPLEQK